MPRSATLASGEEALARLRALLDVNTELGRFDPAGALADDGGGRAVGEVLEDVARGSDDIGFRLAAIVAEWESESGPSRAVPIRVRTLSPRELVESWLAIKESSAAVFRDAAALAPSPGLATALEALALEEEENAARLRDLL
ncbi:MAG TPA: hypothetical protein VM889_00595 [Candidatus Thermoplasmatota archaeon]|nr:hypothetical protein [Candidatus Thermoplasmatota archaeon]